ncbi:MAG TPA: sulfurtransferase [Anaerolineae bacterium]|nr:sulfurtransferase [Anaerolineae bacterium]
MRYTTLINSQQLAALLTDSPLPIIVDCRFDLTDTDAGRQAYQTAHIPGAVYAHLDDDLSDEPTTDHGRHPLPSPQRINQLAQRLGIHHNSQVVAYDAHGGALAARLWWMLQYMGHNAVAVLDGGFPAWQANNLPIASGSHTNQSGNFHGHPHSDWLVTYDDVLQQPLLIDSRAPERYRGEVEPIDAVAGHIPGAVNHFHNLNVDDNGRFLPPQTLKQQFTTLLGTTPPQQATYYCGSGVTACRNLLAQKHAGLPLGRLYVGSWSEWSRRQD